MLEVRFHDECIVQMKPGIVHAPIEFNSDR
jgi:hypothetical protein